MILVTGGEGFIGQYVCARLMAQNYDVIALDTPSSCEKTRPYTTVACDIRQYEHVEQVFRQYPITTLIHLASVLNTASQHHPFDATQVNILGSLHLLEAARQSGVTKWIYGSSISVYGARETSTITDCELLSQPPAPENPYGTAKRHIEMIGMTYQQQFGGQSVALRIASVIGAGTKSSASRWRSDIFEQLCATQAVKIAIPYAREAQLPLVFVEDVAAMIVCLVEATHLSRPIYNTPAEMWTMQALGLYIESIAPHIRITFGQSATGNPTTITGQKFITEFGYTPGVSLRERFQSTYALHERHETQ